MRKCHRGLFKPFGMWPLKKRATENNKVESYIVFVGCFLLFQNKNRCLLNKYPQSESNVNILKILKDVFQRELPVASKVHCFVHLPVKPSVRDYYHQNIRMFVKVSPMTLTTPHFFRTFEENKVHQYHSFPHRKVYHTLVRSNSVFWTSKTSLIHRLGTSIVYNPGPSCSNDG